MAGHEWEDWFEREEFIGQISDIRVQNLQVEREVVQKRTFTRWMNLHLEKCNPPMEVKDLFRDIQDGRILMALLEELSGCKLLHGFKKSSHRIFRLNNIAKVLTFLEERNVKLVSIDAADVADGNSSIVLGLIWNIILFFQIKELTGNIKSQFPSSSSLSSLPTSSDSSHSSTPSEERRPSAAMRDHGKAIKTLLQWVQRRTRKYGVAVHDFGKSWTSGLAFLAVIKSIDPSLVDMSRSLLRTARENLEDAFRTAHYSLGIARLLEPEDVTINPPDEQSIMTYVSQFLEHFPGIEEPQDVTEVIERSVSMGRLSSRSSDSEPVRNGVHRSRRHERPYVVRRDWVQPPPKIFISSVSEEKEAALSPTSPAPSNRPWASKDSSTGSSPSPGGDPPDGEREVFTIRTSNSPQPSYVDSVIGSSAAESAIGSSAAESVIGSSAAESVIGDSAIGSPDSWAENEAATLDRFVESRSDGSLCDSGVAWDANVPPTTPEEAVLDEGLLPSVTGKAQDEQSLPELFIDEGIYSLSSVESTLERANDGSEKRETEKEEESCYILDLNENAAPTHVPDQKQTFALSEKGPSLELSDTPLQGTSQSQHSSDQVTPERFEQTEKRGSAEESTDRNSECVNVAMEFGKRKEMERDSQEINSSREPSDGPGEVEVEIVRVTKQRTSLSEREREEERLKQVLDERQDEETDGSETHLQEVPNGHIEPQEDTATPSGNVLEQTDTHPSVDMDQIRTSSAGPSGPGLDQEDNHTGHCPESEKLLLVESVNSQIVALSDPPKGGEDRTRSPEREHNAGDEDPGQAGSSGREIVEIIVGNPFTTEVSNDDLMEQADRSHEVPASTMTKPTDSSSPVAETQQGAPWTIQTQQGTSESHLHNVEATEATQASAEVDHSAVDLHTHPPITQTLCHPVLSDRGQEAGKDTASQPRGDQEGVEAASVEDMFDKIANTEQRESTSTDVSVADNEIGTTITTTTTTTSESEPTDLIYSDTDHSEPLEPMDLFYPDTEETTLPHQPEREEETFSFSVSALQPAPASEEPLPDTRVHPLTESRSHGLTETRPQEPPGDLELGYERREDRTRHEQEKVSEETPGEPSEPQQRCTASDSSVQRSDLTKTDEEKLAAARDNMESMRRERESDGAVKESQLSAGLRHRKVDDSDELKKDNQKRMTTSPTHSTNSKTSRKEVKTPAAECLMSVSELYFLLVLWLLLYCLLVLQQMDVCSLPSLLLNLEG